MFYKLKSFRGPPSICWEGQTQAMCIHHKEFQHFSCVGLKQLCASVLLDFWVSQQSNVELNEIKLLNFKALFFCNILVHFLKQLCVTFSAIYLLLILEVKLEMSFGVKQQNSNNTFNLGELSGLWYEICLQIRLSIIAYFTKGWQTFQTFRHTLLINE